MTYIIVGTVCLCAAVWFLYRLLESKHNEEEESKNALYNRYDVNKADNSDGAIKEDLMGEWQSINDQEPSKSMIPDSPLPSETRSNVLPPN